MMAYDAQVMEQMSEEEILACLVEESGPKFTVRLTVAGMYSVTSDYTYFTVTFKARLKDSKP